MIYGHHHKFTGTIKFSRLCLVAILALALVLSGGLLGQAPVWAEGEAKTYTWTGGVDGYWHTAGNWEVKDITATQEPGEGDTVVIPALSVVESVYDTNRVILQCAGDLTVSSGVLKTTGASTISGTLVNNGKVIIEGTSVIASLIHNQGTIDGTGNITLDGSGGTFQWNGGTITGTGALTVKSGTVLKIEGTGAKSLERNLTNSGEIWFFTSTTPTVGKGVFFENKGHI